MAVHFYLSIYFPESLASLIFEPVAVICQITAAESVFTHPELTCIKAGQLCLPTSLFGQDEKQHYLAVTNFIHSKAFRGTRLPSEQTLLTPN